VRKKIDPTSWGIWTSCRVSIISLTDSIFCCLARVIKNLILTQNLSAAFGEKSIPAYIPSDAVLYRWKKKPPNPLEYLQDKRTEKFGNLNATMEKLRSKISEDKGDWTSIQKTMFLLQSFNGRTPQKAPYAISGRILIDFKASIFGVFKAQENFPNENKPAYKILFLMALRHLGKSSSCPLSFRFWAKIPLLDLRWEVKS